MSEAVHICKPNHWKLSSAFKWPDLWDIFCWLLYFFSVIFSFRENNLSEEKDVHWLIILCLCKLNKHWMNRINKVTLKDNTVSYCFTLFICGGPCHPSSFKQCSGHPHVYLASCKNWFSVTATQKHYKPECQSNIVIFSRAKIINSS